MLEVLSDALEFRAVAGKVEHLNGISVLTQPLFDGFGMMYLQVVQNQKYLLLGSLANRQGKAQKRMNISGFYASFCKAIRIYPARARGCFL